MERKYTIYAFKQDQEIVYIGMTCNPQKRFQDHIKRANRKNKPKDHWVRKQVLNGTFSPNILFSDLTEDQAHEMERKLLQEYKPKYNVLTYTRSDKKPKKQDETFEAWMVSHIRNYVHKFITA